MGWLLRLDVRLDADSIPIVLCLVCCFFWFDRFKITMQIVLEYQCASACVSALHLTNKNGLRAWSAHISCETSLRIQPWKQEASFCKEATTKVNRGLRERTSRMVSGRGD